MESGNCLYEHAYSNESKWPFSFMAGGILGSAVPGGNFNVDISANVSGISSSFLFLAEFS